MIEEMIIMQLVGQTEASSAEEQLARDNQLKATNCRRDGGEISAFPFYSHTTTIQSFAIPKKTSLPKARLSLNCETVLSNSR
jgi:hypothetical protein